MTVRWVVYGAVLIVLLVAYVKFLCVDDAVEAFRWMRSQRLPLWVAAVATVGLVALTVVLELVG